MIETERLILRPFRLEDAEYHFAIVLKDSGKVIGEIVAHPESSQPEGAENFAKDTVQPLLDVQVDIPAPDLVDMWGPGYSIPSAKGNEAIAMMMKQESIVLDTCYTSKAFAGLVRRAREGFYKPDDNLLFFHTGRAGGLFVQDWEAEE